jgi:sulfur carrier protein
MQPAESTEGKTIRIVVNGEAKTVPQGLHVAQLLEFLAIDSTRIAVELNRSIIRKQDWAATSVEEGAELEIVWFVGGG